MKFINLITGLFIVFISLNANLFSQSRKIDGIAAIIGNEVILESEIQKELSDYSYEKKEYKPQKKCEFLEKIFLNKLIIFYAKQDTLIKVNHEEIQNNVNQYIQMYLQKYGNQEELLKNFGLNSIREVYLELKYQFKNQHYINEKIKSIIKEVDIGPNELNEFFKKHKSELPKLNEEISLAHIILYPKVSKKIENKIIQDLKLIKKEVEMGLFSFADKAKRYSQDVKSASQGGFYGNIPLGTMVKQFDSVIFNLKEGEISDPFSTKFGYHIIKLEKRKDQLIDFRHILLEVIPTEKEVEKTKLKLDSIRNLIMLNKISFKEAALKFSDDKYTRLKSGLLRNKIGEDRFEKLKLRTKEIFHISGLQDGEISNVFEDELENKKVIRLLQLVKVYPEHQLNLKDDYSKIKNIAIIEKQNEILKKWIIDQIPNTFINFQKKYQECNLDTNFLNNLKFDFLKDILY